MRIYSANLARYVSVRKVCLQPVRIRRDRHDRNPTGHRGESLAVGLPTAKDLWGMIGDEDTTIRFSVRPWKTLNDAGRKVASAQNVENFPRNLTQGCISRFFVERMSNFGGGYTADGGLASSYMIISDEVVSGQTPRKALLAHELGHVVRMQHPQEEAHPWYFTPTEGTVMCPNDIGDNPHKNSKFNIDNAENAAMLPDSEPIKTVLGGCDGGECGSCLGQ